jgi:PAS domain S-box-containing protein
MKKKDSQRTINPVLTSEFVVNMLERSLLGVLLADLKGNILYISPAMIEMFGHPGSQVENMADLAKLNFPDPKVRAVALKAFAEDAQSSHPPARVLKIKADDGQSRWCWLQMSRIGEEYVLVNGHDVTEHTRAEVALRESEAQFRNLADQSPNVIFINQGGRIVYVNGRCAEIMGYKKEELYRDDFDFMDLIAPKYHGRVKANLKKHSRGKEVEPFEYEMIIKDGTHISTSIATKLIQYNGEAAILGTVTDISRVKHTEMRLMESQEELRLQKQELLEKNTTLRHVIEQVEAEKEAINRKVAANVEKLLMPLVMRLKSDATSLERGYLDLLEQNITHLVSEFGMQLGRASATLSPRETEICDMVRGGLSSKEIAKLLHISVQTVSTLRNRVRRKLGLRRKGVNLTTYLRSLSGQDADLLGIADH